MIESNLRRVTLKNSTSGDKIILTDTKALAICKEMFNNSVKEEGSVNMSNPDYELKVEFSKGKDQTFFLWIGKEGEDSTLMNLNDSNVIYSVPEKITNQLKQFISETN